MAKALLAAVGSREVSLLHLPLSWDGASWPFQHPLDFLGSDGGGGIGGGPGISVGAALALRGSGRLPVSICGDGDFLMGATAVWTAAHDRIGLLIVVVNNQSFFNDEVHQEKMARLRDRPVENKWIGMRMTDPEIDSALAPVVLKTVEGFATIRPVLLDVGRNLRLSRGQAFRMILLPAALPQIFVGLRLALVFALINVVGVEFLINLGGLGQLINELAERFDLPGTWAAIGLVVGVSICFFLLLEGGERWLRSRG